MVTITVSAAARPPSLAKGLPITLDVSEEATIKDVKSKIAEKFPKVSSFAGSPGFLYRGTQTPVMVNGL